MLDCQCKGIKGLAIKSAEIIQPNNVMWPCAIESQLRNPPPCNTVPIDNSDKTPYKEETSSYTREHISYRISAAFPFQLCSIGSKHQTLVADSSKPM